MKVVDYFLGAGPHVASRIEKADGTVEISLYRDDTSPHIFGHGNTAREAATHLADQLREIARLIEAHEGQK